MSQQNNPLTEIAVSTSSALLIVAASILLYLGKLDWQAASSMYLLSVGLLGGNAALKAPSPAQQAQIMGIVSSLAQLVQNFMQHSHPAPAPVAPPVQQQPAQPVQVSLPQNINATNALPPAPPFVSVLTSGANSPAPQFVSIPPGQSTLPTATQQAALDRGWSAMLPSVPPPQS